MENINFYLVLLLIGIILGGLIMGSFLNRPYTREYRMYTPQYSNGAVLQGTNGLLAIILSVLFVGGLLFFMYANSSSKSNMNISPTKHENIKISQASFFNESSKHYYLKIAACSDFDNAKQQYQTLSQQIAPPIEIKKDLNSALPYLIVIGPFESKQAVLTYQGKHQIAGQLFEK